jgi:hypothetical protein
VPKPCAWPLKADTVTTELDAALNDVVAAGVPGIIVRVKDAQPHPYSRHKHHTEIVLKTGHR